MSPRRSVAGQPPSGGGRGGVTLRACAAGSGTGASCRSTWSCSPDQVPVTALQPSTEPPFSKRAATASKSAPATRTAPFHTGLTRRPRPPDPAIGKAGWNQSPRSFPTRRPVAAARSPSRTTSPSTSVSPGNHAAPGVGVGVQNGGSRVARTSGFCTRVTVHNGGSVRVVRIRGLITQRDEDPSHIKEPADQALARSSGLGLQARPEHPGLR